MNLLKIVLVCVFLAGCEGNDDDDTDTGYDLDYDNLISYKCSWDEHAGIICYQMCNVTSDCEEGRGECDEGYCTIPSIKSD